MRAELLHIYGPFSIHSYGLFIVLGIITFVQMVKRDPRFTQLRISAIWVHLVVVGAAIGLLGGRLLFVFTEQPTCSLYDMWAFWEGGFSVLGGVIAVTIFMPLYLYYLQIPIIPFADLIGIYAPLMLAICRLGCFFAGCCYGTPTNYPWGITYTDSTSFAPLCSRLHPTQLYSALLLLATFAIMYGIARHRLKKPGQLICLFLFLQGLERFSVDFWRADRLLLTYSPALSLHQYLAIGIMTAALFCFILVTRYCKKRS